MIEEEARVVLKREVDEFIESDYSMKPELSRVGWLRAFAHYLREMADAEELEGK